MSPRFVLALAAALLLAGPVRSQQPETLLLPSDLPLVTFRLLFRTGAAHDPPGKEGAAALTAAMLSQGGTLALSYDQVVRALFPMATTLRAQVDKEMTVIHGTTHLDNLDRFYGLLRSMLLEPGWREEDFRRLKADAINQLRVELRGNNDEELGKEGLYLRIYRDHPYGHQNTGTVAALEKMTLDDLRSFYRQHYTQANLVVGLAGGYPKGFDEKVKSDFSRLPPGTRRPLDLPPPQAARKLRVQIIEKKTRAVAISLGFPIPVNRSAPDWPALLVAQSYLGQHRSRGHLYDRLRELRGLNYGDYAYLEYFPRGMFLMEPEPNLGRQQQIFQIWIRPVEPQNALFALRAGLYELDKLVTQGLSRENFESTRTFLSKFVNLLTQTPTAQLGYALDSKYYNIPEFNGYVKGALAKLTVEDVNRAVQKYWRSTDLDVVLVAPDAAKWRQALLSGAPSPVTYLSPKPKEILAEDQVISRYRLDVGSVEIVPAEKLFEQ